MPKYQITLSRERWETCTVVVEGDTKDAAEARAVSRADARAYDNQFEVTNSHGGAEVLESSELSAALPSSV